MATVVCVSLRGPEVFQLDLAGLQEHIGRGKEGILPPKSLKVGTDLTNAPHVPVVLIGHFKGGMGVHHHMVFLASVTMSGTNLRWWLEKLIEVCENEGCVSGLAFGQANRAVVVMYEYNGILHHFLETVQQEYPEVIAENDNIGAYYSFFRSFQKTAEGIARAAGLDSSVQNAMNR